jgi:6-phosphofructokinase
METKKLNDAALNIKINNSPKTIDNQLLKSKTNIGVSTSLKEELTKFISESVRKQ